MLLGIIGFECYYFINSKQLGDNDAIGSTKNEPSKEDNSKYIVDVFTPYNKGGLEFKNYFDEGMVVYQLIDGLVDERIQNNINNKIKEGIKEVVAKYPNRKLIARAISNFENTISFTFEDITDDYDYIELDSFLKRINEFGWGGYGVYGVVKTLNFDLTTGRELTLNDIFNDPNDLREIILKTANERITRKIGFLGINDDNMEPSDYSKVEDSLLSIMNSFNKGNYDFYFGPSEIGFEFKGVQVHSPEVEYDFTSDECLAKGGIYRIVSDDYYDHCVCYFIDNFETQYNIGLTFTDHYDIINNLIIYDKFKTKESIYKNDTKEIKPKFKSNGDVDVNGSDIRFVENENYAINYFLDESIYGYSNDKSIAEKQKLWDEIYEQLITEFIDQNDKSFSVYNIFGGDGSSITSKYHSYIIFRISKYNISKDEYQNIRKQLFIDNYFNRYNYLEGNFIEEFSYLKPKLVDKQFYYLMYDKEGNQLQTKDVLSNTFDFESVIPANWLSDSGYESAKDMAMDSYIIKEDSEDLSFDKLLKDDKHLIIYSDYNKISLKYKDEEIVLATVIEKDDYISYSELREMKNKIFR